MSGEELRNACDEIHHRQVDLEGLPDAGPANLDRYFIAITQDRAIHAGHRGGTDRLGIQDGKRFLPRFPGLLLYGPIRVPHREGWNLVLQRFQFAAELIRKNVPAEGRLLSQLDHRPAQCFDVVAHPARGALSDLGRSLSGQPVDALPCHPQGEEERELAQAPEHGSSADASPLLRHHQGRMGDILLRSNALRRGRLRSV